MASDEINSKLREATAFCEAIELFKQEVFPDPERSSLIEELYCLEWELYHSHADFLKTMGQLSKRVKRVTTILDHLEKRFDAVTKT